MKYETGYYAELYRTSIPRGKYEEMVRSLVDSCAGLTIREALELLRAVGKDASYSIQRISNETIVPRFSEE